MPWMRYRGGGRHVWRAGCRHCEAIDAYRCARDAWEALRESGSPAWGAAGAAHSGAGCHQLSDAEFRELHPPPRFRDFLVQSRDVGPPAEDGRASPWDVAWPA